VDDADPAYTKGRLALDLESLYRQLGEEGLVGQNTKLPWPSLPMTVGLVSTSQGEGCHDFQATLARSGFPFEVQIVEAVMQGENTTRSVLKAMAELRFRGVDVIAIIRGGGAAADLNWFNTYELARAVCEFPVPVLIGLGHERDQTILDRVGWSHKTPSAAAEALVKQILSHVGRREQRAAQVFERVFRRVDGMEASLDRGFYRLAQGHQHLMAGGHRQLAERHHTLGRRAQLVIAMGLKRQQDRQRDFWLSSSRRLEVHQARMVSSERLLLRQLSGKVEPSWHRLRAADTVLALMHARLVSRQGQLQDRQRRLRLAEEQRFGAPRQHMDRLTHGLLTAAIRGCRDADRQSRDRDDRVRRGASLVINREDLKGRMIRLGRAGRAEFQQWARALSAEQKRLVSVSMRVTKIPFTRLDLLDQQFRAHDPLHQLGRGFAIVTAPCGRVVRSSEELVSGERVSLRLVDGVRHAIISDINADSLLPAIGGSHAQADS
jgi:exodeoxyribonuclease VII large subunit